MANDLKLDSTQYVRFGSIAKTEQQWKDMANNYFEDRKDLYTEEEQDKAKYIPKLGEYIYIKVALTDSGKIISCETTAQKETDGIGSACADEKFYSQFNGKDETNYGEIDAISGATITTNGYKTGVSKVFEAVKILEGVA